MKITNNKIITLFFSVIILLTSCDNYDRTEVVPTIHVNHQSLNMFIGDEKQLIANPNSGQEYVWDSEDPTIATVSDGLVKAISEGTTLVTISSGNISTEVPITVSTKVATTDVQLSSYNIEVGRGSSTIISATIVPSNANDISSTDFEWWSENESVAVAKSTGEIIGISYGSTKVHYRRGSFTKVVTVEVVRPHKPFRGPHIVSKTTPLTMLLADFDLGGEGLAYHDTNDTNDFGSLYRENRGDYNSPGVDVYVDNCVANTASGEWLIYTIQVEDAGIYQIKLSVAGNVGGNYYIEVDEAKLPTVDAPTLNGWAPFVFYPETPQEVTLSKGNHVVKVVFNSASYNANEIKFVYKQ